MLEGRSENVSRSRRCAAIAAVLIVGLAATSATAGLGNGLVDPLHSFPMSYTDATGLALQPCLALGGGCGPAVDVPTTFPNPVQYWTAIARMQTYGGKGGHPDASRPGGQATATLVMELLGTFALNAAGDPVIADGQQVVIQSLQIRMDSLLDQQLYTVTTPFGMFDDIPANVVVDEFGQRTRNVDSIKQTFQLPADPALPGMFDQSAFPVGPHSAVPWTYSGMDHFLGCAGGPQPSGFLGLQDPSTGALLECAIAGSPLGPDFDVFRVEGPEVGGGPNLWNELAGTPFAIGLAPWVPGTPPVNMIETTQFRIIGHVTSALPACSDGGDNDGDGTFDFPDDPGCDSPADISERSAALVCDDDVDNDGDGAFDYPGDPGCVALASDIENPQCQDGIDNDGDGSLDFDGGASQNGGIALGPPDPQCIVATGNSEMGSRNCGMGAGLALVLPALVWWRGRRRTPN